MVDRIPFGPDRVEACLFWPSSRLELDRDGRPQVPLDGQGACVVAGREGLEITRGVYREGEECSCCWDSDVCDTAFRVWLPVAEVHPVVDVLAGLPRRFDAARVGEGGVLVWRGRRSQDGSAVIERAVLRGPPRMPGGRYDGRDTDRSFDVVSTVAVGLPAPPPDLAVPLG